MTSELLSASDLKALTGRTHLRKQQTVLKANNIKYTVDADGKPIVFWADVQRAKTQTDDAGANYGS
jgi:hypothetical protein|tara:strand:+ start:3290 stop:3487 length:198 start_codon:yes stop_codon:yes gene_type:complete